MSSCMVPGCSSSLAEDSSVEFFLFPKSLEMCQLWVEAFHLVNAEINLDEGKNLNKYLIVCTIFHHL